MHMADALLSPEVGLGFCGVSAAAIGYSASRLERSFDERHVPLMGVLGAFVFAAQMVNFTIPGTGSSGHLIGGVLLAVLLGGHAALITMASVLIVQSLFFADGGILALGANIFNMGVYPCLLGGLAVRAIAGDRATGARAAAGIIVAAVLCLELGALSVAAETVLSGKSDLPFTRFAGLMMAIHLPIGVGEGILTWTAIKIIYRLYPLLREGMVEHTPSIHKAGSLGTLLVALGLAAALLASGVSWFASSRPDGLEWSLNELAEPGAGEKPGAGLAGASSRLQRRLALMAGYRMGKMAGKRGSQWPDVDPSTSAAGLLGGLVSLGLAAGIASAVFLARRRARRARDRRQ